MNRERKYVMKRLHLSAFVLVVGVMAFAVFAGSGLSASTVSQPLAGDTATGQIYLGAEGTFHLIAPADFVKAGLDQYAITWYASDLPGSVGAPATREQVASVATNEAAALAELGVTVANPNIAASVPLPPTTKLLAGDKATGDVYLAANGTFHLISAADFVKAGLTHNSVMWYGGLPGTTGTPATPEEVAAVATSYADALKTLGVTLVTPNLPLTISAPPATVKPMIPLSVTKMDVIAGKTFSANFHVFRSDNGAKLLTGTMSSAPSVNGKVIYPHYEKFQNGIASVRVTIPANAKGKVLKVPVTIKLGNESFTHTATFQIN